jgi:hypothetical protein
MCNLGPIPEAGLNRKRCTGSGFAHEHDQNLLHLPALLDSSSLLHGHVRCAQGGIVGTGDRHLAAWCG